MQHLSMDLQDAKTRFNFLADAMTGSGGFAPVISYGSGSSGISRPTGVSSECYITPHQRESKDKYAQRVACAVYENHLRQACERFAAYLSRKAPSRAGTESPLVQQFISDADDAGRPLDVVLHQLALDTKARGTMLLLVDLPKSGGAASMADALTGAVRAVPYISPIAPELVNNYSIDDRGRFVSIGIDSTMVIDGKIEAVVRQWDAKGWQVLKGGKELIEEGLHPFGICPVLCVTENGGTFPQIGKFAQIADLSRRMYNVRCELDSLLRDQNFSLLTLQIPSDVPNPADFAQDATATIGTHSLLIHQGQTPAFIAPDRGPAQVYLARIAELQETMDRVGMETSTQGSTHQESGVARKMRFEALNSDLASFARLLQGLETQIWQLFNRVVGGTTVQVQYPTDYNLTDSAAELDILALMQATGHPEDVLREKRRAIVLAEFDRATPDTLAMLQAALDEQQQAQVTL